MSVTYKTAKMQSKLIGNGRPLIPVIFNFCGNTSCSVRYHSESRTRSLVSIALISTHVHVWPTLSHRVRPIHSRPLPSLSQVSSPSYPFILPHSPPPRSETLARVLPAPPPSTRTPFSPARRPPTERDLTRACRGGRRPQAGRPRGRQRRS
jgi:hypothetical protein